MANSKQNGKFETENGKLEIFQVFLEKSVKNQQKHTATRYHFDNKEILYEELDVNPKTLSTYFKKYREKEICHLSLINLPLNLYYALL